MHALAEAAPILALFGLGGGEVILVLALLLILLGARHLPSLGQGLRQGFWEFRKATKQVADDLDDEAMQAGRSAGGIYGKPVLQALTPDNHVAERYDPDSLGKKQLPGMGILLRLWRWTRRLLLAVFPLRYKP
jgi:sec-independent protein translocase protein TatA